MVGAGRSAGQGDGVKKYIVVAVIAAAFAAFFAFDLGSLLTIDSIKAQAGALASFYREHPLLTIGAYFAIYVAATALSFPGAAVLTLAGGALFGVAVGTLVVSFASTLGATLAFLVSRYLLRDAIERRFGDRLGAMNRGVEKDGAFYLFTLRMVPIFPFFLVNLLMGLTRLRTWTFAWVSQIGMLLGTIVYVNAGTQLAQIDSLSGIASPGLILSFAALGVVPWIAKWLIARLAARRVYAGFTRPRRFDRNLVVIGAGSAGLVSALIAATVRARVTLVEAHRMGGDCLNTGCVPSKALIKSAKIAEAMRHASRYGLADVEPQLDFRRTMARIREIITTIEPHDSVERFTGLGVDVVLGRATIVDPWTVEIARNDGERQRLTTRAIVIAAGGEPFVPPLPGIDATGYLTSDTMWDAFADLDAIPRRIAVLGGGPIGCELSQALARLGAEVTQVERGDRILPREDEDAAAIARASLAGSGVTLLTGHEALRCEVADGEKRLVVRAGDGERAIGFDVLIVAVGRAARLTGYGLEALGIETDKTVQTDAYLATRFPNIYAAGDVAGPYQFTHVASHQAWFASVNALFGAFRRFRADYRVIPWTTFLDPEIARVGLNEQDARAAGIAYEVTRYPLDDLDRAIAESATHGFVKVLTPPGKDRILGVTIVGEHAGELLAEYVLAMKHGLGLNKILATIHTYPTMAEANKFAAGEWKKAHKPEALLRLVGRYHDWMRG